jgi:hypothetical protein
MIGSIQKWWGVAGLALLCMVPCAFANSALTVTGAGDKMGGFCVGPHYATGHGGANTPLICDDFANETHIAREQNYSFHNFSSLGNALWGNRNPNVALNGLNSPSVDNWLGMMPSNLTTSHFSNFIILTPKACPIGPGSCRVSVPEGGSEATYLLMAALSCFAAILFRRRLQTAEPR